MQNALTPADFVGAMTTFEASAPRASAGGGAPLLRMLKGDGSWVFGADNVEVEPDARWAIDPASLAQGFIAWHGGKVEAERMAMIGHPPVDPTSLGPVSAKNGWEDQVCFGLVCQDGEDKDTAVVFKSNTHGGRGAFFDVFDAMKARAVEGLGYAPLVVLRNDSYQHTEYGKIFKPIFEIVGWLGDEEPEKITKRRRRK